MLIAISAGHHPHDPGAVFGDYCERDETPLWQAAICRELGAAAFAVPFAPLRVKIDAINRARCSAAVEIHFNASVNQRGHGCEALYAPNSLPGMRLASTIQHAIAGVCAPNRGVHEGWYRMDRPGHIDYPGDVAGDEHVDAFLKRTRCPAVIAEPLFIHERARIAEVRDEACRLIALAIMQWAQS